MLAHIRKTHSISNSSVIIMQNLTSANYSNTKEFFYTTEDFARVEKFDAHMHVNTRNPVLVDFAKKNKLGLLSINVDVPDFPPLTQQRNFTTIHQQANKKNFGYITSFQIKNLDIPGWLDTTLAYLDESFKLGAVGVKVWKNIGMEYKDKYNQFVMIDDAKLDPVFDFIERNDKTLIGHLGEPRNCWLPSGEMTVKNDREYFEHHPEYHMYLHPEFPSYEEQINARDRMLEKHPNMRFVGAHLASLEWSTDEIAKRLNKFPNMAVDLAERISHLQYQAVHHHQKVRDFFIQYQDRVLYATDITIDDTHDPVSFLETAHRTWSNHWKFFTSDDWMEAPEVEKPFRSLHLPKEVIDKLYWSNVRKWYPALATQKQYV